MPISRDDKQELVQALTKNIQASQAIIITDYRGLPTPDLANLRNQLRGMKASYHVAKNTLVLLALKEAGLPAPEQLLEGPTAVAFLTSEISGPARVINAFFKEKNLPVRGAIVGQSIYDAKGVEQLASLPTREQLYAQVLGALNGPASNLVGVLNGALSELLRTLQARAEQGEGAGQPA
ncbi:MAG: 50S ribosomal protein L10 [Anaerolineae bacterium]